MSDPVLELELAEPDRAAAPVRSKRPAWARPGTVAVLVLLVVVAALLILPYAKGWHPDNDVSADRLSAPFGHHLLGTDALGRSVGVEMVVGLRASLLVGVLDGALDPSTSSMTKKYVSSASPKS